MATAAPDPDVVARRKYNTSYVRFDGSIRLGWNCTYELDGDLYYLEASNETPRPIDWDDWSGVLVLRSSLYTPLLPSYTRIEEEEATAKNYYIKRAPVYRYAAYESINYPAITRSEIAVHEVLAKHPHPNILRYHGVLADKSGEYVAEICFDQHGMDLKAAIKKETSDSSRQVDREGIMGDVRRALEHLHSLGYIHNDVNPRNVLLPLTATGSAILGDFDSCVPLNTPAADQLKRGTYGYDAGTKFADEENDWHGWRKTAEFLGIAMQGGAGGSVERVIEEKAMSAQG